MYDDEGTGVPVVLIAGARSVVMDNVGHAANVEDPDRFNAILLDFVEATTSPK